MSATLVQNPAVRRFISAEETDRRLFLQAVHGEFPVKSEDEIAATVEECRNAILPSESRSLLLKCVRAKLRGN